MKRSRFNEEQIIAILKEQEAGMATAEVCRRHGISSATFYKWKSKFGGLAGKTASRSNHQTGAQRRPDAGLLRPYFRRPMQRDLRQERTGCLPEYRRSQRDP